MSKLAIATRGIAIFDTHIGTWAEHKGGKYLRKKTHNESAIKSVLNFAEDFRPDIFIHGGDYLDWAPISHWNKERAAEISHTSLQRDIEAGEKLVLSRMAEISPRLVFIKGNHEAWLQQFLDKYPCLDDILNLDKLLNLSARGFKIIEQGGSYNVGKLHFMHGDTIANGKYHSASAASEYMRNVVYGHRHTFQAFTRRKPLEEKQAIIGLSVPGLCDLNPHYSKRQYNEWVHGFCYFYILTDGTFTVHPIIMNNARFAVNGKVYTA